MYLNCLYGKPIYRKSSVAPCGSSRTALLYTVIFTRVPSAETTDTSSIFL